MSSGRRVVAGSGRRSAGGVGAYAAKSSRAAEGGAGRSPQTFLPTTRRQTKASRHCWIASPLPTGWSQGFFGFYGKTTGASP